MVVLFKLIKLEWKKNNIGKYIRNAMILSLLLGVFIFSLAFLGIANDPDGILFLHQLNYLQVWHT